jgi:glycosyltransferase involved in cell wall biosynthesis
MIKEWKDRKILYVQGGKRFLLPDGEIYGYPKDMLISLKDRYLYLGADVKFVQYGIPVNKQKYTDLINLRENGVEVIPVKYYLTPQTYKYRKETKKIINEAVRQCDILIVRMPSLVANIAQQAAIKYHKPYIIEVVGCTWEALWQYSKLTKIYAPFSFFKLKKNVAKAKYVIYVSSVFLQQRYPNAQNTCSISNVILQEVSKKTIENKLALLSKEKDKYIITTLAAVDVLYKGQHFVIKAIAKLRRKGYIFEYHIAGAGDQTRLKKIAERFGVTSQVIFDGMLNVDQVCELLDNTDIYVQPSLTEGLPRAVIEAMSRGCPTIGTEVGGIPELVGKNFIFRKRNVTEISSLLSRLADNKELLISLSKENFEKSQKFNRTILDNKRKVFYDKFLTENPA